MGRKSEKRMLADRRGRDTGPPDGWRERRKTVERRRPEVSEIQFSEWLARLHDYLRERKLGT